MQHIGARCLATSSYDLLPALLLLSLVSPHQLNEDRARDPVRRTPGAEVALWQSDASIEDTSVDAFELLGRRGGAECHVRRAQRVCVGGDAVISVRAQAKQLRAERLDCGRCA